MTEVRGSADQPDESAETESRSSSASSAQDPQKSPGSSRRQFLRTSVVAAATAALAGGAGLLAGRASQTAPDSDPTQSPAIDQQPVMDHVVVLMGENRSFDNLLGWLYTPDTLPAGQKFDGLAFGTYSNKHTDGTDIPAHVYSGPTDAVMGMPNPDPGEEYPHVNTQLFGTVLPAGNAGLSPKRMLAPYNAPTPASDPPMSGFVTDYVNNITRNSKSAPSAEQAAQAMGGFDPGMLPVLSTLAREFAVFDHWFAAAPTQTYPNRSFFNASTSHGFVTNRSGEGYKKWLDAPASPTIFNLLEDAGLPWRIYFDRMQLVSMTGILHSPALEKYWKTNHFAYMEDFFADAQAGTLPAYSFIEPRMIYNHNDFHPPVGVYRESTDDGTQVVDSAVSDVRAGEALVASVYDAIRTSDSSSGSNAMNTMLLITFFEHGGTYDHVPPPKATAPGDAKSLGEMDFEFDRLGVRVPTIAVSAYTAKNTVINDQMHHGAVIATLCRRWGLASLTARDEKAKDLTVALNLAQPRPGAQWPLVHPSWVPPNPDATLDPTHPTQSTKPLSPPARGLLGLVLARAGRDKDDIPQTYGDAFDVLIEHGQGLFTDQD